MREVSQDVLWARLSFDNPWWKLRPETEVTFRHPPQRLYFDRFAGLVESGDAKPLILAGPRRSGKTVLMRQMLARLIETGAAPTSVFYAAFTTPVYPAAGPEALVEQFLANQPDVPRRRRLTLFLDEVQYVKDWGDRLVALARRYPQVRVVASVSSEIPGLGTEPRDDLTLFVLPHLTFLEFLRFRGSEEKLFGPTAAEGHIAFHESSLATLNAEFVRYITFGGFPEGIMLKNDGAPAPTFLRDVMNDRVLHKDLAGLAGISDAQELNRLFTVLAINTALEVSIEDLSSVTGIAKNTVRKYLDFLESAFLIRRLRRVDRDARPFQRAVAFKVYLTTPCLYTAMFGPPTPDDPAFPRLVETAMVGQWLGSIAGRDLAYASWRTGQIDLLAFHDTTGRPDLVYEMDWQDRYSRPGRGPETLARFAADNSPDATVYVLTRATARPGVMRGVNVQLIPAALYAYLLHKFSLARRSRAIGGHGKVTAARHQA